MQLFRDLINVLVVCVHYSSEPVEGDISYIRVPQSCVYGSSFETYENKNVDECKTLCSLNTKCVAFEYGVAYGGGSKSYQPRDCLLRSSAKIDGCDGSKFNLDLYVKDFCCDGVKLMSTGLVLRYASRVIGTYTKDNFLNGKASYRKDNSNLYLYVGPKGHWVVTDQKNIGTTTISTYSECKDSCPSSCINWRATEQWIEDSTSTIECEDLATPSSTHSTMASLSTTPAPSSTNGAESTAGGISDSRLAIIGAGVAVFSMLCATAIVAFVVSKKKKSEAGANKTNLDQGDDNYDIAYEEPTLENFGDVYGDVSDDIELQVVENPYYGDEEETNQNSKMMPSSNMENLKMITSRQNDYYEM